MSERPLTASEAAENEIVAEMGREIEESIDKALRRLRQLDTTSEVDSTDLLAWVLSQHVKPDRATPLLEIVKPD